MSEDSLLDEFFAYLTRKYPLNKDNHFEKKMCYFIFELIHKEIKEFKLQKEEWLIGEGDSKETLKR